MRIKALVTFVFQINKDEEAEQHIRTFQVILEGALYSAAYSARNKSITMILILISLAFRQYICTDQHQIYNDRMNGTVIMQFGIVTLSRNHSNNLSNIVVCL